MNSRLGVAVEDYSLPILGHTILTLRIQICRLAREWMGYVPERSRRKIQPYKFNKSTSSSRLTLVKRYEVPEFHLSHERDAPSFLRIHIPFARSIRITL